MKGSIKEKERTKKGLEEKYNSDNKMYDRKVNEINSKISDQKDLKNRISELKSNLAIHKKQLNSTEVFINKKIENIVTSKRIKR